MLALWFEAEGLGVMSPLVIAFVPDYWLRIWADKRNIHRWRLALAKSAFHGPKKDHLDLFVFLDAISSSRPCISLAIRGSSGSNPRSLARLLAALSIWPVWARYLGLSTQPSEKMSNIPAIIIWMHSGIIHCLLVSPEIWSEAPQPAKY